MSDPRKKGWNIRDVRDRPVREQEHSIARSDAHPPTLSFVPSGVNPSARPLGRHAKVAAQLSPEGVAMSWPTTCIWLLRERAPPCPNPSTWDRFATALSTAATFRAFSG